MDKIKKAPRRAGGSLRGGELAGTEGLFAGLDLPKVALFVVNGFAEFDILFRRLDCAVHCVVDLRVVGVGGPVLPAVVLLDQLA